MSIMDELKRLARPYSEDEEDEYEDEYEDDELVDEEEEEEEEEPVRQRPALLRREAPAPRQAAQPAVRPVQQPAAAPASNFNNNVSSTNRQGDLQMVLVKPERYDEVSEVAKQLRKRNAIVLNLENTNADTARRLVDFLSGCAFALDGSIKKVATSTYVITPEHVDVVGDLVSEAVENPVITYDAE